MNGTSTVGLETTMTPLHVYLAIIGLPIFLLSVFQLCNNERVAILIFRLQQSMKPVPVGVTALAANNLKLVEVAGPLQIVEGRAEDR